jgi:hypothetical protein
MSAVINSVLMLFGWSTMGKPHNMERSFKITNPESTCFFDSARIKCIDFHDQLPWVICALYNGSVVIVNYQTEVRTTFDLVKVYRLLSLI